MSLKAKIEAVIYASEEPVTLAQLIGLLGQVEVGLGAFIAHGHIRRQAAESSNDVGN